MIKTAAPSYKKGYCKYCKDELYIWGIDEHGYWGSKPCPECNPGGRRSLLIQHRLAEYNERKEMELADRMEVKEWNANFKTKSKDTQADILNALFGPSDPSVIARVEARLNEQGFIYREGEWWHKDDWEDNFGDF